MKYIKTQIQKSLRPQAGYSQRKQNLGSHRGLKLVEVAAGRRLTLSLRKTSPRAEHAWAWKRTWAHVCLGQTLCSRRENTFSSLWRKKLQSFEIFIFWMSKIDLLAEEGQCWVSFLHLTTPKLGGLVDLLLHAWPPSLTPNLCSHCHVILPSQSLWNYIAVACVVLRLLAYKPEEGRDLAFPVLYCVLVPGIGQVWREHLQMLIKWVNE